MRTRYYRALTMSALVGAVILAGCGSATSSSSTSTTGSTATTGGSSSTPGVTANSVTVGSISDISSPSPGLFEGAKIGTEAYFAYINSRGGVNGRKLILDGMDSAFSSGKVANETKNITTNDFAIVGGYSLIDGAEQPAIDAARLPVVTQVLTSNLYNDPNVYSAIPVTNGDQSGPYKWLKKRYSGAYQAVGLIGTGAAPSAVNSEHRIRTMTYSLGYKWLYERDASYTETTFLSDVIKMKAAGVKIVLEPTLEGDFISNLTQEFKQQGLDAVLVGADNIYEKGFNPGAAGNGSVKYGVTSLYMGEDAKVIPAVATFDKWARKVDPSTQLDLFTLYGWINAQLFVQALKGAGANPTRSSLVAQLNKITSFNASGLISSQNPARNLPGQCWLAAQYENGKWARISPDPKSGFVCDPNGFYPSGYTGIPR